MGPATALLEGLMQIVCWWTKFDQPATKISPSTNALIDINFSERRATRPTKCSRQLIQRRCDWSERSLVSIDTLAKRRTRADRTLLPARVVGSRSKSFQVSGGTRDLSARAAPIAGASRSTEPAGTSESHRVCCFNEFRALTSDERVNVVAESRVTPLGVIITHHPTVFTTGRSVEGQRDMR